MLAKPRKDIYAANYLTSAKPRKDIYAANELKLRMYSMRGTLTDAQTLMNYASHKALKLMDNASQ